MSIEKIKPRFTMDKKIVIKYGTEYDEEGCAVSNHIFKTFNCRLKAIDKTDFEISLRDDSIILEVVEYSNAVVINIIYRVNGKTISWCIDQKEYQEISERFGLLPKYRLIRAMLFGNDEGARCLFLKTLKAGMESFQHITHIMELFKR